MDVQHTQFFDDNMVLQRDTAATLYGTTGVPGELVSVELVARSTGHTGARAEARTNTTQLIQQEGKATKTTFTAKVKAWVDVLLCSQSVQNSYIDGPTLVHRCHSYIDVREYSLRLDILHCGHNVHIACTVCRTIWLPTKVGFTTKRRRSCTQVAANGSWVVHMDAQKASSGWTVTVTSGKPPAARTRVLKNVAFGDVYLWAVLKFTHDQAICSTFKNIPSDRQFARDSSPANPTASYNTCVLVIIRMHVCT